MPTPINRPFTEKETLRLNTSIAGLNEGVATVNKLYGSNLTPISVLSTENAISNVNKGLNTLNTISPTTAPGYVAPVVETPATPVKEPKAYFTNEAGQEVEATEAQLRDKKMQKLLQDGGYFQTRTEGPNYDTTSDMRSDVDTATSNYDNLAEEFINYNVDDDPAFQMMSNNIKNQYEVLRNELIKANESRAKAVETLGFRTGASQYAGGVQGSIQSAELSQANARLFELNQEEATAISAARTAHQTGKYSIFTKQLDTLEKIRDEKQKTLTTYNEKLSGIIKTTREGAIRSSRDGAIAGLLAQGITDPVEILGMLNYDETGKQTGDFTAKEVAETLKNIAPNGDIDKLSGDVRDFFILKQNGTLPGTITSLPEEQQLSAFMRYMQNNSKAPITSGRLFVSSADLSEGVQVLEKSKGTDGYVNSAIYKEMYDEWIANGGLPQDFLKYFPPRLYVNPNDASLPASLRSGTGAYIPEETEEDILNKIRG